MIKKRRQIFCLLIDQFMLYGNFTTNYGLIYIHLIRIEFFRNISQLLLGC